MVIQVLNSELQYVFRSHLQPSLRPREPYTKIHKHRLNHGIITKSKIVTETRIVIPSLEFKTCMTIKS